MLVNHGEETIQAIRVGEIHIHVLDWEDDSGCSKSRGLGLLPREEQVEYSLIRPDERRREFLLSRLFLRRILAGYLHQEESSLRFIRNPRGKPTLAGSNLQFNLAHTAGRMVCSVGWTPVGIDVEKADPQARPGWRRLAERFFTPEEKEYLFTQPSGSQPLFFFQDLHDEGGLWEGAWDRIGFRLSPFDGPPAHPKPLPPGSLGVFCTGPGPGGILHGHRGLQP